MPFNELLYETLLSRIYSRPEVAADYDVALPARGGGSGAQNLEITSSLEIERFNSSALLTRPNIFSRLKYRWFPVTARLVHSVTINFSDRDNVSGCGYFHHSVRYFFGHHFCARASCNDNFFFIL